MVQKLLLDFGRWEYKSEEQKSATKNIKSLGQLQEKSV